MLNSTKAHYIGGVYTEKLDGATAGVASWGAGTFQGIKYLELIANDYTYTFKTTEQKFNFNDKRAYGP